MKKLLFLFNPVAGKAQITGRLYSIINFYTKKDYLVTALPTEKLNKLLEILEQDSGFFDIIVCAGGDGTLNGVISKCMSINCTIPIGYLPVGTTNDFAKTLGYSTDFSEALSKSCGREKRSIDIGSFNNQYFVYVAAFGSLAEVSYSTSQLSKNILGHFAYLFKGVQKVTDLKTYKIDMEYNNGRLEGEFCMGLVMNSLSIGGFKNPVSEFVLLDDGLFEVMLIRKPKNLSELQQIISDLIGQRISSELIEYIQTNFVRIRSDGIEWSLDGEYGGIVCEAIIQNCKQAIRIVGA